MGITIIMATSIEILAVDKLKHWSAVKLEVEGNKDWDKAVFDKICTTTPYSASSCGTKWSSAMAKAMWTYTDGYSLKMSASNAKAFNPTGAAISAAVYLTDLTFQYLCLSKTTAAAKDKNEGRAADGSMCFVYQFGLFHKMDYISKADFAAKGFTTGVHAKWSVAVTASTAANTAKTNGIPLSGGSGKATEFASEIFDNSGAKNTIDANNNKGLGIGLLTM